MDIKESSIFYDEKNEMYKVNLGFYTRFFEFIIYNNNGIKKIFGEYNLLEKDFLIDSNFIFGISNFLGYKVFNILNLDTFEDIYRIVKDINIFSFQIKGINYYLVVFIDLEDSILYYTNFYENDFSININENKIYIKNNIFDSIIFDFNLNFSTINKENILKIDKKFSFVDFYFFDNIFSKYKNTYLIDDFLKLKINFLKVNNNLSVIEFQIYQNDYKYLKELNKLFLSINNTQLLCYLPLDKVIKNIFNNFSDVSNLDINNLDFNFEKPSNIFEYDEKFLFFSKNYFLLEYVLYVLKLNYKNISNNNVLNENKYNLLFFINKNMTKENLEKNILFFEEKFNILKILINSNI